MDRLATETGLYKITLARKVWAKAKWRFQKEYDQAMAILLHQAARNFMSVEDVAKITGLSKAEIRKKMRNVGLDPRRSGRVLSDAASKAITENAEYLGLDPNQMDLTSPLAYLPLGEQARKEIEKQTAPSVTKLPTKFLETPPGHKYVVVEGRGGPWLAEVCDEFPEPSPIGLVEDILRDER